MSAFAVQFFTLSPCSLPYLEGKIGRCSRDLALIFVQGQAGKGSTWLWFGSIESLSSIPINPFFLPSIAHHPRTVLYLQGRLSCQAKKTPSLPPTYRLRANTRWPHILWPSSCQEMGLIALFSIRIRLLVLGTYSEYCIGLKTALSAQAISALVFWMLGLMWKNLGTLLERPWAEDRRPTEPSSLAVPLFWIHGQAQVHTSNDASWLPVAWDCPAKLCMKS